MFKGDIDHAAILNTRWYAKFCQDFFGEFIHHDPLDFEKAEQYVQSGAVEHTINTIAELLEDKIHPLLSVWVKKGKSGQLRASHVSCIKNDYDN